MGWWGGAWLEEVGHWRHAFEGYALSPDPSSLALSLSMPIHLPAAGPKPTEPADYGLKLLKP
jgi:hypothetical protein